MEQSTVVFMRKSAVVIWSVSQDVIRAIEAFVRVKVWKRNHVLKSDFCRSGRFLPSLEIILPSPEIKWRNVKNSSKRKWKNHFSVQFDIAICLFICNMEMFVFTFHIWFISEPTKKAIHWTVNYFINIIFPTSRFHIEVLVNTNCNYKISLTSWIGHSQWPFQWGPRVDFKAKAQDQSHRHHHRRSFHLKAF